MRSRLLVLVVAVATALALLPPTALADADPPDGPALDGASAHEGDGNDHETTEGLSEDTYEDRVRESYRVPVEVEFDDGETEDAEIYGVVYHPVDDDGEMVTDTPVILTYSPYNVLYRPAGGIGEDVEALPRGIRDYYVPKGYAVAEFDLVGTRESSGCYDYGGHAERQTGAAVVDFLGSQDWSNGKVGMVGASYDGTTAYSAAIEDPEHLVTIVPQVAIDRWYDYSYHGAVRRQGGSGTPLLFDFGFAMAPPTGFTEPGAWSDALMDSITPCSRVEHQDRGFNYDPIYDAFWDERDYRAKADNVSASVLVEGGWRDFNVRSVGSTRFWQALPDDHPKKLVMGQWAHATPDADFEDWEGVRHAWFDYWLMGYDGTDRPDTGVMDLPRVDTELNTGERVQLDHWPPETVTTGTVRLVEDEPSEPGDLALEQDEPTWHDNDPDLSRQDAIDGDCGDACITFVSDEMPTDVRLSGVPELDLLATTTPYDTDRTTVNTFFVVSLFTEDPDGDRHHVTPGMLNSRNRDGFRSSEDLPPGQPYEATVELADLDWIVEEGHRLGIAVASYMEQEAFVPRDERTTNTLELDAAGLALPVSEGHEAVGVEPIAPVEPDEPDEPDEVDDDDEADEDDEDDAARCPQRRAPAAGFADRGDIAEAHRPGVDCLYERDIAHGEPRNGEHWYVPAQPVSRDQMAAFVARTMEATGFTLPEPSDQGFDDIDGNVHADDINRLAEIGVITGRTETSYEPGSDIRRDQMAAFLIRAARAMSGEEHPAPEESRFHDSGDSVHRDDIEAGAVVGLVEGRERDYFDIASSTRRDEMGSFLIRLLDYGE